MGTYEELKAAIQEVITTNGNNEITGALLQQTLLSIVNSVGANATFAGMATPQTNPGTPEQNVFYLATTPGTYANFGNVEISNGEVVILSNQTGQWVNHNVGLATLAELIAISGGKNVVNFAKPGYVASTGRIAYEEAGNGKVIVIPVQEGEEYIYYSKYSTTSLTIAFCENETTWFDRYQVVQGWQNIVIPSGCNYLAITIQFGSSQSDAVKNAFLYNKKILGFVYQELSNYVSYTGLDNMLRNIEVSKYVEPTKGVAYSLVVGQEPSVRTTSIYASFRIPSEVGDKIKIYARSGSSYPTYGLIKDNVVVSVSRINLLVDNEVITNDGTFDEIIVNNYQEVLNKPQVIKRFIDATAREIKILMFGNSFTQDSMAYVPFILENVAPNIKLTLGIAYIGGCSLVQHLANLLNENIEDATPQNYTLQIYEAGENSWKSGGSKNAIDCLKFTDWDIITFQQSGSLASNSWETAYAPYIYAIHKAVFANVEKTVKLGWMLIQGAYATTIEGLNNKWALVAENSEKIEELTGNQIIFPFGTAVRNLATIPSVADIGDGAGMTADGGHLHEGLPCLCAAYANTLTILEQLGMNEISIIGESTRPTKEWCTQKNIPGPNYGATTNDVVGVTDDNCFYAQIAAIQAVKKPYEFTDCSAYVE